MSTTLLTTKLFIPLTRPNLGPRQRLIERLNEGLHRKLSLISAPAGFGKITLVTGWIQAMGKASLPVAAIGDATQPIAIAWLSLNDDAIDLARFLTYFIAALNQSERMDDTPKEVKVFEEHISALELILKR